jgi:MFS superfamily sulfate permease-like transporter
MVANAITKVFEANSELSDCLLDSSNETIVVWYNKTTSCEDIKRDIAVTLSFFSGIIMILMGVFKLGFITIFLSEPLISGYTTGAAVHVFTSQIKHIFGLNITSERGLFSVPKTWIDSVVEIFGDWTSNVNNVTLIISIITIFILIIFRIVDRKLLRKIKVLYCHYSMTDKKCTTDKIQWFIPLPSQIIIVIFGTGISYAFKFNEEFNVTIVGKIPSGPPDFTPPVFYYLQYVWTDAFVISIVTFAISVSLSQVFAKQFSYSIDSGQELLAYGAMNLIGSLFKSFNSAGSLSRSTVQAVSGGKTQLVGIISSVIIFFTLLWIGRLFEQLPNAILASIIWVALYGMFSQVVDVWRYFKLSIADVSIWIVVFGATVLLGVDLGLGVGVLYSLFTIVFKLILPKSVNLGRVPDTEIYRDIDMYERVESVHGVIIYRFQAPLCFVNCKVFQLRLDLACGVSRSNYDDDNGQPGCIQVLATKVLVFQ